MPKIGIRAVAVLMFGPPGSGKGTVSKHLVDCFELPHISTGDILRENVARGTELGKEVKAVMDAGQLVSDDLVNRLVEERIGRPDCRDGLILDGYPRTLEQGKALARLLEAKGLEPLVVYLDVDYNEIVTRLTARRSCPQCGTVYNLFSKPPKQEGVCDVDGVPVVVRNDDREEVIRQRLENYDQQSRPLVDFFRERVRRFYSVNGSEGSPEEVAERACRLITTQA